VKYYEIIEKFENPNRWHLTRLENQSGVELDPRLFTEGLKYGGEISYPRPVSDSLRTTIDLPLRIAVKKGCDQLDFTFGPFNLPVVSSRIAEHLEAHCKSYIQLLPLEIAGSNRRFEVLNVLCVIDAVDRQRSEISWRRDDSRSDTLQGSIGGIANLVLRDDIICESPIFRLKDWELPLIVDEELKHALETMHPAGIRFKALGV
jgi:hypothetical protein